MGVVNGEEYLAERRADVHETRWSSPFAVVGRRLRALLEELVGSAVLPPGATVVDLGCADAPYRDLFDPSVRHVGVDLPGNPVADVHLAEDGTVPMDDGAADLVLSTQVLEHVGDPARYLAECRRLLRPGGTLVLSTHGLMYLHRDPTDYWRWTCDGLERIVREAGFDVVEVRGVLALPAAALQLLQDGLGSRVPRRLRRPYVWVFQRAIAFLDDRAGEGSRRDNGLVLVVRAYSR